MAFDRPFFGAKVFLPMATAVILACGLNWLLRPAWYWGIMLAVACIVVVFGAVIWRDQRA